MDLTRPTAIGAWLVIGLAVVVPWLTWWGLTTSNPSHAATDTPILLAGLGLLLLMAVQVGQVDLWLGLFAGYVTLRTLPITSPYGWEAASVITLGAIALVTLAHTPWKLLPLARVALLSAGVAQAVYAGGQWIGYDPIWLGWGVPIDYTINAVSVRGTLANSNYLGCYMAVLLALAPVWLIPVFAGGLLLSKSLLAIGAAVIGLAVRYRQSWVGPSILALGLAGASAYAMWRPGGWDSLHHRVDVWQYAIADWWQHPVLGWGTGAWAYRIPLAQVQDPTISVHKDVFVQAHHEYLQVLYDGGLIGLALLLGWLWMHRSLFTGTWAGGVTVLAVNSVGFFPFHVGTTGLLAVTVLGLALAEERSAYAHE